ncbi:major facilitator superfamily domain-containing protein [Penicillium cataractarum]|uniref:Major facilitator superfamily domain-containing protein n=1 Tax=Penicillium cataractarum TaxID=2100454 RepID=A0A9W9S195_9EURO|nr:major facilitator superfamily domain-containing protein [Penicillium cataractarum]KAJ5368794.1 major facilitator superfamily domain-containing protein [Penicillium cataractarum]
MAQMSGSKTEELSGDSIPEALSTEGTEPSKCEVAHTEYASERDVSDVTTNWTLKRAIAVASLAGLYTGSQIMLYFVGGALSYVEEDLNAADNRAWLPVSNTLAIAGVAPFVGYLQYFFGRRRITLIGEVVIMSGLVILATSHHFRQAVAGMALCGAGAAVCELTALAGIAEIVPVRSRGWSIALLGIFLIPFALYVLYAQLLSYYHTWRWTIWLSLIYNGLFFLGVLTTYFPKKRYDPDNTQEAATFRNIDYVGAVLSIVGITLFLVAIQASGGSHFSWSSTYVLVQLALGIVLIISWAVWEWKFARVPMIPHAMFAGQRTVGLAFLVAFIASLDLYSLINFLPLTFSEVYSPEPLQIGLRGLGYGISVTAGATIFGMLLSVTWLPCRWIITSAAVVMTAFGGAIAISNPTNVKLTVALGTIGGFGVGVILVPAATLAMIVVPDSLLATTAALSLSIRTVGGSIGNTIYFNIFINKLAPALPKFIIEHLLDAGLNASDATAFAEVFMTAPDNVTQLASYSSNIETAAVLGKQ